MEWISKALFVLQHKVQEHRWGGRGARQLPAGDWARETGLYGGHVASQDQRKQQDQAHQEVQVQLLL